MSEIKDVLKETIISFETAVLAEKCGFPQIRMFDIHHHYNEHGHLNGTVLYTEKYIEERQLKGKNVFMKSYVAPSQAMLQKWIRNKHNIFVTVSIDPDLYKSTINYSADVLSLGLEKEGLRLLDGFTIYQTYEEALEQGLQETLKLILEKNETKGF